MGGQVPTAFHHAYFIALAEPTGLTALPPVLINRALVGSWTHVVIMSYEKQEDRIKIISGNTASQNLQGRCLGDVFLSLTLPDCAATWACHPFAALPRGRGGGGTTRTLLDLIFASANCFVIPLGKSPSVHTAYIRGQKAHSHIFSANKAFFFFFDPHH